MIELERGEIMPSTITHAFIGIDTIDKLNNKPKEIINNHLNNYKVYCQNMDVLYFYHIFLLFPNKTQKIGHLFHQEHVYDVFKLLIDDNLLNKDPELFTFIAGLIVHYQADAIMHPYINHFIDYTKRLSRLSEHFKAETYLDNYFVHERLSKDHKRYNNTKFVFNYTKEDIIIEELDKVFKTYFNFDQAGKKYYRALAEMKFAYNYARYDKYGIKRFIYQIIDLNPFNITRTKYLSYHFDLDSNELYLNTNHDMWFNPHDSTITSNKSFFDLYQDVLDNSSYIINELYKYIYEEKDINTKKLIKNINYGTGLEIK